MKMFAMTNQLRRQMALSLAMICVVWATISPAQPVSVTEAPWYQVELIVFEHSLDPNTEEQWPRNIALAYPPNVRYLINPEEAQEQSSELSEISAGTDSASIETPFVLLDAQHMELRNSAAAIKRERQYRLLFHETWRQPMVSLDASPAIIIIGGEKYENHNELEGTITLSVSRYLHLRTNLWLTQFESNYGQTIGHWPPLPKRPLRPEEMASESTLNTNVEFGLNTWKPSEPVFPAKEGLYNLEHMENNYGYLSQQPFVTKNIVLVEQQRRMRSDELHYIDHPKVGILIRIRNYSPLEQSSG